MRSLGIFAHQGGEVQEDHASRDLCLGCARYRIPAHADSPRPDAGELKPDPTSVWAVLTGQCGSPIISARVTAGESCADGCGSTYATAPEL